MSGLPLAGLACALALAAAGCSDDEEPESNRAPATEATAPRTESRSTTSGPDAGLSAAEYRRRVNAMCVKDERLVEKVPEPSTADGFGSYLRRLLELYRRSEREFRAIEPPPALRRDHQTSLDLGDEVEKELQGTLDRLQGGAEPTDELRKILPVLARSVEEGNKLSRRMGTRKCIVEVPNPAAQPDESTS